MVKPINLDDLSPDPITAARAEAGGDGITVTGFVRSVSEATIAVSLHRDSQTFVEYPRDAIGAVFEDEESSGRVTLLVHKDAEVQVVSPTRAGVVYSSVAIPGAPPHPLGEFATDAQRVDESTIRRHLGPGRLQPDGTIIYKEKCHFEKGWICSPNGCEVVWWTVCEYYPE